MKAPTTQIEYRVLIVEDNPDIRETTCELLSLYGYQVLGAASGVEALAVAPGFTPDAVVLDVGLPDIDGYEVGRQLRANSQFATTKLIALTGYNDRNARSASSAAGFDHHMSKPLDFEALKRLLT